MSTKYKLSIVTGDVREAGTDAIVYVNLKGDKGQSGVQKLLSGKKYFERASIEEREISCQDLGDLESLIIGHDNSGWGAGWFLATVTVRNLSTSKTWEFNCNRWFDSSKEDKKVERELTPQKEVLRYKVTVYTSDIEYAGTDANIFIDIQGSRGSTGKRQLNSDKGYKAFERGNIDFFTLESEDIGIVKSIHIGQDAKGLFSEWHLKKVTVLVEGKGEYFFECNEWFAKEKKFGGILERTLQATEGEGMTDKAVYTVEVLTSDFKGASTTSNVEINLIGRKGESKFKHLENSLEQFTRNKVDKFVVKTEKDLGDIIKIVVKSDCSGISPDWLPAKFSVKHEKTGFVTNFTCGMWFSNTLDDKKSERELAPSELPPRGIQKYRIDIKTMKLRGAGTDANVYINIFGEDNATSGKKLLDNSQNNFESGMDDVFEIACLELGNITKIVLGHDNSGFGPGWMAHSVKISSEGKEWFFPISRWFAKDEDDGLIERELVPSNDTPLDAVPYEVIVFTGDRWGAGTDANVSIEVYGEHGRKIKPTKLDNSDNNFERNKRDAFLLKSIDLGELQKIRISHDNSGIGPGWFLDKVAITNQVTQKQYFFICGRWLDKSEDDGQIVREIPAEGVNRDSCGKLVTYKIDVTTGDRRGAGTDANVFIVLYGDKGDSGDRFLDGKGNDFERGQTNSFGVECVDLGELVKIRIGHDNKGIGPGWFLATVQITNLTTNTVYYFPCGHWFAKDEEDMKIVREISVHKENVTPEPLITYRINVFTGDRRGAGTNANVYILVFGDKGESGPISLESGKDDFERGRQDNFEFESVDLGDISRIEIGHDNKGIGAGWFLSKVEIISGKGRKWTFGCNKWLAKDEDDGAISRTLEAVEQFEELKTAHYKISVTTGDRRGAGTDANVFITVFGKNGKSNLTFLDSSINNFERNTTDVFGLECDYLGELTKITIGHDNKGFGAAWFLDKVEIHCEKDDKTYFFLSGKWFSTSDDDKKIVRDIPASGDGVCSLPLINYLVQVFTGDRRGAGTDANVLITIYGENGDTGKQVLDGPGNDFERNQKDEFGVEAVDLGELQKIRIGHDDSGIGSAWFLDKVVITNLSTKKEYYFLCGKWLDSSSGDKQISREIPAKNQDGQTYAPLTKYKISVFTGDRRGAGTDANVFIHLFGDKGESGDLNLDSSANDFERGQKDVFGFEMVELGELKKIRIGHDNKGIGAGWLLDKVVVYCEKGAKEWYFPCGRWLDMNEDDGKIVRELDPVESDKNGCSPLTTYNMKIFTADRRFAGTDAQVHIQIFGEQSESEVTKIDAKHGSFERGSTFEYSLECGHLGKLKKIRIGHNNKGISAGWLLDKVIIKDEKEQENYFFLSGRWFADDEEDGLIEREIGAGTEDGKTYVDEARYKISVFTGDRRGAGTDANVFIKIEGENGKMGPINLNTAQNNFERNQKDVFEYFGVSIGKINKITIGHDGKGIGSAWFLDKVSIHADDVKTEFFFLCGEWIDSEHGLERIIEVAEKDGSTYSPLTYYEISVFTSDIKGAGTDAGVFVTLYGDKGDSGERKLDNSQNNFERGKKDVFGFELVDIGKLNKLRIRHDNKGFAAGWHLAKVVVKCNNNFNYFVCNKWLDTKEDDGLIERYLGCSEEDKEVSVPMQRYKIQTITGDISGAGTDAKISMILTGENGSSKETTLDGKGNNFERAQTDEFEVNFPVLGDLKKLRIGHNSTALGSGWFLEKVIVTPLSQEGNEEQPWYFVCHRWLDHKEDDFQTMRELGASREDKITALPYVDYKITVFTGDRRGAGTDANVSVTLFGENGDSGNRLLDAKGDSFERGKASSFNFELLDLGKIVKLRIGHDNKGIAAGWFLDKVIVQAGTGETYFFLFGRWLDENEDDKQIIVEGVPAPEDSVTYLSEVTYKIRVKTGDRRGAGTDANVFIELYGDKGKSGEKVLDNKLNNFERNEEDLFGITCVDIGTPTKIRIRHDNSGFGSSWFLDKVIIHNEKDQKDYYFLCGKWLSTSEDDKLIEREIPASNEDGICSVPLVSYKISVKTGNRWGAGTDANVSISIYGDKGDTGKRLLSSHGNCFERDQTDEFGVQAVDIGEVQKIRIEHDNSGFGAPWFLESITIDNGTSKWFFGCGHWLSRDHEDGAIVREISATDQSGFSILPIETYTVTVTTGDRFGAGTNAQVYAIIYGAKGDSGKRFLDPLKGGFERSSIDSFQVECVDLGELSRIEIGHDNKGLGSDWFLDKVTIKNGSGKQWFFLCGRWLSSTEDDKRISRELKATEQDSTTYLPLVDYKITIKTADRPGAGTDANIYIVITGKEGESNEFLLDNSQNNFEKAQTDVFTVSSISLGELNKIRMRTDNRGIGGAWLPESIQIYVEDSKKTIYFPTGGVWLDSNNLIREFSASDEQGKPLLPVKTYEVEVKTGDIRGAGTDSNVYIEIYGENGNSGRHILDGPGNNFERNKTDIFGIDAIDLGKLLKIQIGHDNAGIGASWFLDKVKITDMSTKHEYFFNFSKWIDKENGLDHEIASSEQGKESIKSIRYNISIKTGDCRGAGTDANVFIQLFGETGKTGVHKLDSSGNCFERGQTDEFSIECVDIGEIKRIRIGHDNAGLGSAWFLESVKIENTNDLKVYRYLIKQWFDAKSGDKKLEREITTDTKPGDDIFVYKVVIITGVEKGAGTDANVYLHLVGDKNKINGVKLDGKGIFERGRVDHFQFESSDLGELKSLTVGHDNTGIGPGWFLNKIYVINTKTKQRWQFPCGRWLADDEDDKKIVRELEPKSTPTNSYSVIVKTGDIMGAGTDSAVFVTIVGNKGETERTELIYSQNVNKFERAKKDVFVIDVKDVGTVTSIKIGTALKLLTGQWNCESVQVIDQLSGNEYNFKVDRWVSKKAAKENEIVTSGKDKFIEYIINPN